MANVDVIVSVSDDHLGRIPKLVEALQNFGMMNIQSLEAVGVITGSVDESKVADIPKIEGVGHTELSRIYQLPPPNSPLQ